jgi:hypothetical protein
MQGEGIWAKAGNFSDQKVLLCFDMGSFGPPDKFLLRAGICSCCMAYSRFVRRYSEANRPVWGSMSSATHM